MPQLDFFAFLTEVFWVSFIFLFFRYFLIESFLPSIKKLFFFRFFLVNTYYYFNIYFYDLFFLSSKVVWLLFSYLVLLYEIWFLNFLKIYNDIYFYLNNLLLLVNINVFLNKLIKYYPIFTIKLKNKIITHL